MPSCAIITCRLRSEKVNLEKGGISFHRFPTNPDIEEKWITATGRKHPWFPTKSSSICSKHFTEDDYLHTSKKRHLKSSAVPQIDICVQATLSTADCPSSEPPLSVKHKLTDEEAINVKKICFTKQTQKKSSSPSCSNASSPRKRKLKLIVSNKDSIIKQQRSKIRKLQAQNRRLKKKVTKVEVILDDLQKKLWLRSEEASILKNTNLPVQELIARYTDKEKSGSTRIPYSPALRSFALTLHYYSPKAYEYVRQSFNTCLPHASTIRKWYSSVHGDPGFSSESFAALKAKAESTDYTIIAALTMDEMAIRRRIEWDGEKFHGCVEFGSTTENDLLAEAKEALVFLITAVNASFKIPVAYFLVDGITGTQRADLVTQCLERIQETGVKVVSLTFDGCASNVAMMHELGCSLANNKIQFDHPVTKDPVVAILDPSHMVKLIRNTLQMYNTFIDKEGNKISWSYLTELNKIQETEKFHLANKLRRLHINYQNQKMKVKLATQTFSKSVADALNFCEKDLQLPSFTNSASTAFFITLINNLFDIYNSRNMYQHGFKRPLNKNNVDEILPYLDSSIEYLSSIKDQDGTLLIETPRKTGFLGFIACAEAIKFLYTSLVKTNAPIYLPFYKLSQDHLELLFCNIRSHGGFNNNPTARQFKAAYKKLLVHVELKNFNTGNCTALENMSILNCSSPIIRINATSLNMLNDHEYEGSVENSEEEDEEEEAISLLFQNLTEFSTQVISYIAGNVVRVLQEKIKCEDCISSLHSAPDFDKHKFIIFKDKGGLIYPSKGVISICKFAESVVRSYVDKSIKITKDILVAKIMRNLVGCSVFTENFSHGIGTYPTSNHLVDLKKSIIERYINIRLHFLIKTRKSNLTKRQLLNKYILFQGQ